MLKKIPKAFFLFLIFFIATEIIIYFLGPYIASNPNNYIILEQVKISKGKSVDSKILVFGDSAAAFAIDLKKMYKITGLTCYSFATMGPATMAINYYLLDNYLRYNTGGSPKYIVLMNAYDSWRRDINSEDTMDILANSYFIETFKAIMAIGSFDSAYKFILHKVFLTILPSQRYKSDILRLIKNKKQHLLTLNKENRMDNYFHRELLKHNGNYRFIEQDTLRDSIEVRQKKISEDILSNKQFVENNKFNISKFNSFFLDKFIMEAKKKNIKIFICFPPLAKEFYGFNATKEYLQSSKVFLKNISISYDNIFLLNNDVYVVDNNRLTGALDHLSSEGAIIFTEIIANNFVDMINAIEAK